MEDDDDDDHDENRKKKKKVLRAYVMELWCYDIIEW